MPRVSWHYQCYVIEMPHQEIDIILGETWLVPHEAVGENPNEQVAYMQNDTMLFFQCSKRTLSQRSVPKTLTYTQLKKETRRKRTRLFYAPVRTAEEGGEQGIMARRTLMQCES